MLSTAGRDAGHRAEDARGRPARPSRRGKVVLVVDDEPSVQEVVSLILESEGNYEVWCASNGEEALRLLAVMPQPDVMVVDMMMPVMDGWDLLRALRVEERTARIPVIVSSASAGHDLSSLRVARVLPKPLDYDAFLAAVGDLSGAVALEGSAPAGE